ncbi:Pentatricopeptide repeat-containing protein [Musa troglodytarum]|uniref:Pentatricopeptide repeat-containing protein n=1 Tax=Musa troglodytarum TaxID=320322 RepID=A0A9E7JQ22_9LILI|nr:Pentatricopeptide repeat-containing protein [Musa troglodytarum]
MEHHVDWIRDKRMRNQCSLPLLADDEAWGEAGQDQLRRGFDGLQSRWHG